MDFLASRNKVSLNVVVVFTRQAFRKVAADSDLGRDAMRIRNRLSRLHEFLNLLHSITWKTKRENIFFTL